MAIPQVRSADYEVAQFSPVRFEKSVPRKVNYYPSIERLRGTQDFNSFSFKLRLAESDTQLVRSVRVALPIDARFYTQVEAVQGDKFQEAGLRQVCVLEGDETGNSHSNIALGTNILKCFQSLEVRLNGHVMSCNSDFIDVVDFVHCDGTSEFGPKPNTGSVKPLSIIPLNRVHGNTFGRIRTGESVSITQPHELLMGQSMNVQNQSFADRNRAFLEDCEEEPLVDGRARSVYRGTLLVDVNVGLFANTYRKNAVGQTYKNIAYPFLRELFMVFTWNNLENPLEGSVAPIARNFRPWVKHMFQVGSELYYFFNGQKLECRNPIAAVDVSWREDPTLVLEIVQKTPELQSYQLSYPAFTFHKTDEVKVQNSAGVLTFPNMHIAFRTIQSPSLIYIYARPGFRFRETWLMAGMFRTFLTKKLRLRINTQVGAVFNLDAKNLYELSMQAFSNYMTFNEWISQPVICLNLACLGAPAVQANDWVISSVDIECELEATKLFAEELDAYKHTDGFLHGFPVLSTAIYKTSSTPVKQYDITISHKQKVYNYALASVKTAQDKRLARSHESTHEISMRCRNFNAQEFAGYEFLDVYTLLYNTNSTRRKAVAIYKADASRQEIGITVLQTFNVNRENTQIEITGRFQFNSAAYGATPVWEAGIVNGKLLLNAIDCATHLKLGFDIVDSGGSNSRRPYLAGLLAANGAQFNGGAAYRPWGVKVVRINAAHVYGFKPFKISLLRSDPKTADVGVGSDEWGWIMQPKAHAADGVPNYLDELTAELCVLCERGNQIGLMGRNSVTENPLVLGKHYVVKDTLPEKPKTEIEW